MRQFDIQISTGKDEETFPVYYAVENYEEDCMQIFRCKVNMPKVQLPSWLSPGEFELITHVREDVQMVDYSASMSSMPNTPQTDEFLYKVYAEIFFREYRRRAGQYPEC